MGYLFAVTNVDVTEWIQNQQRELTIRHAKETEREMQKRLDVQKVECEETIKRHIAFIDQVSLYKCNLNTIRMMHSSECDIQIS